MGNRVSHSQIPNAAPSHQPEEVRLASGRRYQPKWETPSSDVSEDNYYSAHSGSKYLRDEIPKTSNFDEMHLERIAPGSEPRDLESNRKAARIDVVDPNESKMVSICLMAMQLESIVIDNQPIEDLVPNSEPFELTQLVEHWYHSHKPYQNRNMSIENIGSILIHYDDKGCKFRSSDNEGCVVVEETLTVSSSRRSKDAEIKDMKEKLSSMANLIEYLHEKIGELENAKSKYSNSHESSQPSDAMSSNPTLTQDCHPQGGLHNEINGASSEICQLKEPEAASQRRLESNRNLHSICNKSRKPEDDKTSRRDGKQSTVRSQLGGGDSRKGKCNHNHHAVTCSKCTSDITIFLQKQHDLASRMQKKKEFSNKIKLLKGKNISSNELPIH